MIGATSSPRLAWQVRSRPFSTQLITSLQQTQGSRSGLISPIFFTVTLLTGVRTTEASPCANGDWVVYIGSNCEWELVNVYTRHRVPLPKISAHCPEVEHTGNVRTFKYDHGDCLLWKIAICRVPNRSWNYINYEVVSIFNKLVAVLGDLLPRMCTVMQFNTRVLCLLPPLVAQFLHGIIMLSVHLSSTVIIIVSFTCMRVSKAGHSGE